MASSFVSVLKSPISSLLLSVKSERRVVWGGSLMVVNDEPLLHSVYKAESASLYFTSYLCKMSERRMGGSSVLFRL